jgi:D-alanine-D-alanine ligase
VRFGTDGNLQSLLNFLEKEKPQLIFNLCEGIGHDASKEMNIAAIFELLNIPFTGSGALTLGTSLQKTRVKEILTYHNISTPKFQLFNFSDDVMHHQLHFPLIVKPSREDASIGIENTSIVKNNEQLYKRVHYIHERFSQPALVEEFIDGREINAALLGFHNAEVLPLSEIDMSTLPSEYPRIITYNAKWMKGTIEYERTIRVCPAPLPKETEEKITSLALKAFHLLGCRDYARVDFRLSHNNEPYILEVNPNPDISEDAGFAASALAAGYSYHQFVEAIIHSAMERLRS